MNPGDQFWCQLPALLGSRPGRIEIITPVQSAPHHYWARVVDSEQEFIIRECDLFSAASGIERRGLTRVFRLPFVNEKHIRRAERQLSLFAEAR